MAEQLKYRWGENEKHVAILVCDSCNAEVYWLEGGYICSSCGKQEDSEEEKMIEQKIVVLAANQRQFDAWVRDSDLRPDQLQVVYQQERLYGHGHDTKYYIVPCGDAYTNRFGDMVRYARALWGAPMEL